MASILSFPTSDNSHNLLRSVGGRKDTKSSLKQADLCITLGHTPAGQPIQLTQDALCRGTYILGITGSGKTSLLEQVFYEQAKQGKSIIVLAVHRGFINNIIARLPQAVLEQKKLHLLNVTDIDYPFSFNPFACYDPSDMLQRQIVRDQVMAAFSKLWPRVGDQLWFKKTLRLIVRTLLECPELTLAHVKQLLTQESFVKQYIQRLQDQHTIDLWKDEFKRWNSNERLREHRPLLDRVAELLEEDEITKAIVCQKQGMLDFRKVIEQGEIIIAHLPVLDPRYKVAAKKIGMLLMSVTPGAIFSFADLQEDKRPGCTLIVDEFQNFASDDYATLFTQGRQYQVKPLFAHQYTAQLDDEGMGKSRKAARSADTIIAMKSTPADSRDLAANEFRDLQIQVPDRERNLKRQMLDSLIHHRSETVKAFGEYYYERFLQDLLHLRPEIKDQRYLWTERKYGKTEDYLPGVPNYTEIKHNDPIIDSEGHKVSYEVPVELYFEGFDFEFYPKRDNWQVKSSIESLTDLIYYSELREAISTLNLNMFLGGLWRLIRPKGWQTSISLGLEESKTQVVERLNLRLEQIPPELENITLSILGLEAERDRKYKPKESLEQTLKAHKERIEGVRVRATDEEKEARRAYREQTEWLAKADECLDKNRERLRNLKVQLVPQARASLNAAVKEADRKTEELDHQEKAIELGSLRKIYMGFLGSGNDYEAANNQLRPFREAKEQALTSKAQAQTNYQTLQQEQERLENGSQNYFSIEGLEAELVKQRLEHRQAKTRLEQAEQIIPQAEAALTEVTNKLEQATSDYRQADSAVYEAKRQLSSLQQEQEETQKWLTWFKRSFSELMEVLTILIADPIAEDKAELSETDIAGYLRDLEIGHALINTSGNVSEMEVVNLNQYQKVASSEFEHRLDRIIKQTRQQYCRTRRQVEYEIYSLPEIETTPEPASQKPQPLKEKPLETKPKTLKKPPIHELPAPSTEEDEEDWKPYSED